jgi:hypothetical protein
MANEKISELPDGSPAQPGDEIPIARGGANFFLLASDIAALGAGIDVSIGGNTAGAPSLISSGTMVLAGGNNITLSQNAGSISIIGGAGIGGGFSAGVSNIGNTLGNTGVTGTQLVLAGGNNVTLSQFTSPSGATVTISAINQSVQTQNVINASMAGNTAGVAALVSSGTLFLAGGNNVTLSQNGNSITISANTAAAANLSVSAGSTSGAFGGLTFANSNNATFGLNNGTITASYAQSNQTQASGQIAGTGFATTTTNGSVVLGTLNTTGMTLAVPPYITTQSNQTQNLHDVTLGGNTSGALALISSGTMFLAGGNNITLSQAGQSVTVSGAAQTAQSVGLYAISQTTGQSSFSTADARSLSFAGSGGVSVGMSNGSVVIQGATAVPPSTAGINAAGNTTGQSFFSTYQQSSAIFSGAGIISVGWSSNSFIISAPASTGISQSMFAASNTTQGTSGTQSIGSLVLAGAGNVSVGVSNGSYVISGAGGGGGGIDVSLSGNTTGTLALISSGTMVLAGGNNITLSQNGQSVTISGGAGGGASTAGLFATGNTTNNSTTTVALSSQLYNFQGGVTGGFSNGSVQISAPATSSISGTGQVSIAVAGSTISVGVPTQSLFATGNTTQGTSGTATNGSLLFNGAGNVSVGYSNGSVVISGAGGGAGGAAVSIGGNSTSAGAGYSNITSGTAVLLGGNNITLSQNGASITISGGNAGNAASLFALGNTTQNSSTALSLSALSFNGLGEVTVGYSNGSIQISAPPSSLGVSGGNTSGTSGTFSGQMVFAGGNNITLSVATAAGGAQTITISGANAGGAQTGISGMVVSNTTYTSGTVTFQNANGISFGSSGANGISASYTVPSTAGLISGLHLSGGAGTSNNVTGLTFANSNNFTFGLSTGASVGTMTASYSQTNQNNSLFALGNTTQSSSTVLGAAALSFNGLGGQTVGFSNGSIQLSVPPISSLSATGWASISVNGSTISIGAAAPQLSFFQPLGPVQNTTVTQNGAGSVQVYPAIAAFPFSASRADIMISASAAVLAVSTQAQTISMFVGLYSLNGSTLSLASSGSQSYAMTNSSNASNASITGIRRLSAPINVNYSGGFDLFVGVMTNTTFANTNGMSFSNVVVPLGPGQQLQGLIGQVPANSMQFVPGMGLFSATSAGMPSSMALSAISGAGSGGNAVDNYSPVQFANVTA